MLYKLTGVALWYAVLAFISFTVAWLFKDSLHEGTVGLIVVWAFLVGAISAESVYTADTKLRRIYRKHNPQ